MVPLEPDVGVLTMAYGPPTYVRMAEGLARSIRLRNPGARLAVVSDADPRRLRRLFDVVVPVDPAYGPGLAHKLHLDRYSPFAQTLFVDADFLMFHELERLWWFFRDTEGFGLFGRDLAPGEQHYAIEDVERCKAELGVDRMVMTNTGILYFDRSPTSEKVFETARLVAGRAGELGMHRHPVGYFNDEPIFGAAVTLLGLPVVTTTDPAGFTLAHFGTGGMDGIDVRAGHSRHEMVGQVFEPVAIHFNVDAQKSRVYDRELRRLELGPLGRTPLPDLVTAARWAGRGPAPGRRVLRRLARAGRGLARRLLEARAVDACIPWALYARLRPRGVVERAARRSPAPFHFVQVGSHDGRTDDPVHATAVRYPVRGILVEPVPQLFARLSSTYADAAGLTLVNAAVGPEEGRASFHWVQPRPGDPPWVDQLGSFSRDVILRHGDDVADLDERITALPVDCRTLASLVAEHAFDRVDLLHVDAEGWDFAILQTVDFTAAWAPRFILYEQKHLGDDKVAARAFLRRRGYRTVDFDMDVFAYRARRAGAAP